MMMPLRMSANDWLSPNAVEISLAPLVEEHEQEAREDHAERD